MEEKISRVTPEQKIVTTAQVWRRHDRVAINNKQDDAKQRAEYRARMDLRKVIDEVGGQS